MVELYCNNNSFKKLNKSTLKGGRQMENFNLNMENIGRIIMGVKTPIIRTGDGLQQIVIDSCLNAIGEFHDKAVIGVTEAVVAIAQGNFASPEDIQADILRKFPGASEITLLFPIQSRNRFMNIPRAIADMPEIKRINVILSYPCDEVGNRFVSDEILWQRNIEPYADSFSSESFYSEFGKPRHPFTGKDYIEEFLKACNGKGDVLLCNNLSTISYFCKHTNNILVCSIRKELRELHKKQVMAYGAENVLDLSQILNEPVNGSGYSPEYGLYGSNMMAEGKLKLMPRDCQTFVEGIQAKILQEYGKHVEVMVYGDGAFKDPVGGIWELADPVTTLAATSGLAGTPKEVKLKYLASKYPDKNQEELAAIIAKERENRLKSDDITSEASLGTTPRQKTDLFASWADLTTGSGDEQTPVVYALGFLK